MSFSAAYVRKKSKLIAKGSLYRCVLAHCGEAVLGNGGFNKKLWWVNVETLFFRRSSCFQKSMT
eukprot:9566729-Prorocentrum_lima.AAC.1